MARGAQLIQYKGKEIYFIDYSNIRSNSILLQTLKQTSAFREKLLAEGKKDLLMLVDVTNFFASGEALDKLKKNGRLTKQMTKKEAVVGLKSYFTKVQIQIFRTFTKMQLKSFDQIDKAKDWLVED